MFGTQYYRPPFPGSPIGIARVVDFQFLVLR